MADPAAQTPRRSYPSLADSPLRVTERKRFERWWFADGIWLDQGKLGASVGFVWTHWLADRGVQVADEEIDDEYAIQLYRDAQRAAGFDPSEDTGTWVSSGAEVLEERGLLQTCYACHDADTVVDALLERGPVIAGFAWCEPMGVPVEFDGWMVSRWREDSPSLGGHCVLLNGIALDLTIDGVTGFVRFKNSWGTGWADGGHALLSIEDLAAALQPDTLLPIPAADALKAGLRQDVAGPGAPYRRVEELFEQSAIGSDAWTNRDAMGAEAYANAIARGIQHPETKPPLTIGIKGAWGAGKTSLMRMIQERLEWPEHDGGPSRPRPIQLRPEAARRVAPDGEGAAAGASLGEVTNRTVLEKARRAAKAADEGDRDQRREGPPLRAEPETRGDAGEGREASRWRPTVWFNPWMYQTGEQIWAGLAHEIIDQTTNRMSRREKEHFWLQLNLRRVDEEAVRRKLYRLVLSRVVPWLALAAVLLVAGIFVLALGALPLLGAVLTAAGPTTLLLGTGLSAQRVLSAPVTAGLSDLVRPAVRRRGRVGGQLAEAYESVVEQPDYRGDSGALYLTQADVRRVLDLVATEKRPLVIFIDDLDRCSPGSVVQVIEAVNLFLAGDYPNTIFVIAMEPEVVAAHVETVYCDLVERLERTSGQSQDLGWRFLEKIVQLPLAVPTMGRERTAVLLESLFSTEAAAELQSEEAEEPDEEVAPESVPSAVTLSEAIAIAGDVRSKSATRDRARSEVERRLTLDDPEVLAVIDYAQDFLHHNPREIKRFVNLFRFFTMIHTERRIAGLGAPASLRQVAKIAVLGIRWPGLLSVLALPAGGEQELTLFELLERQSGEDAGARASALEGIEAAGLNETITARLLAPELSEFLAAEPRVGAGVRGYL